jgi:DNA-binding MarR family transcriptional regulator
VPFDSRLLAGIGVLSAVVESGSFIRAGEAVGLTPSGVSRAVARLEARVGVRLFDRTPRAVTLTDEGRRFHAQVMPLLAGLEDAASEAAGAVSSVRGRLRVNLDPWVARLVLAPALPGFLEKHPALSIELVVRDTLGELIAEGFDAAVRFGEPGLSGLVARKLLETRILTCAAPGYLARHGAPDRGTVSAVRILSVPASAPGEGTGVRGFCCRECGVVTDLRRLATHLGSSAFFPKSLEADRQVSAKITRHLSSVEKATSPAAIAKVVVIIAAARNASVSAAPASAMTAPASAVAIRLPVRAVALLKPDAVPVCCRSTDDRTAVVNGATAQAMPNAITAMPGRMFVQ